MALLRASTSNVDVSIAGATGRDAVGGRRAAGGLWRLRGYAPLIALIVLGAAVRLSTIGLQSFWFDEAFTPVHVIHPSLIATMKTMSHTENSPPLWYFIIWVWTRLFGTGVVAMRLPSAFAGIALIAVAWGIGDELAGRRAALAAAALAAFNPLFVWYSQEARTYELYALTGGLAVLCFLRAEAKPTGRRMAAFAAAGALALLSHYFAVFLLVPMALWLLRRPERWRITMPAVGVIAVVGVALIPLLISQGGHGTQWIGKWPLKSRLEAIPQYYLTGYSGAPLGRGIELLVALPLIFGAIYALIRRLDATETRGAWTTFALAACGVLIPILFVAFGADYLAPRNLIAAMVPVTGLLAVLLMSKRAGTIGVALTAVATLAFLAICVEVDLNPRLQRGDWSGVAAVVRSTPAQGAGPTAGLGKPHTAGAPASASAAHIVATVHLGSAPLQYYMPGLRRLPGHSAILVSEIDEVAYPPLLSTAGKPPLRGFRLLSKHDVNGLLVYRFAAAQPQRLTASQLRYDGLSDEAAEVFVAPATGSRA